MYELKHTFMLTCLHGTFFRFGFVVLKVIQGLCLYASCVKHYSKESQCNTLFMVLSPFKDPLGRTRGVFFNVWRRNEAVSMSFPALNSQTDTHTADARPAVSYTSKHAVTTLPDPHVPPSPIASHLLPSLPHAFAPVYSLLHHSSDTSSPLLLLPQFSLCIIPLFFYTFFFCFISCMWDFPLEAIPNYFKKQVMPFICAPYTTVYVLYFYMHVDGTTSFANILSKPHSVADLAWNLVQTNRKSFQSETPDSVEKAVV